MCVSLSFFFLPLSLFTSVDKHEKYFTKTKSKIFNESQLPTFLFESIKHLFYVFNFTFSIFIFTWFFFFFFYGNLIIASCVTSTAARLLNNALYIQHKYTLVHQSCKELMYYLFKKNFFFKCNTNECRQ